MSSQQRDDAVCSTNMRMVGRSVGQVSVDSVPVPRLENPGTRNQAPRETADPGGSLRRGLAIIEALAGSGGEMGVRELARHVHMLPGAVHRYLAVLCEAEYAQQNPDTRRYALGPHIQRLADMAREEARLALMCVAHEPLERLDRYLRERAHLADRTISLVELQGWQAVYVYQIRGGRAGSSVGEVNARRPLYCTAAGKIFLSLTFQPQPLWTSIWPDAPSSRAPVRRSPALTNSRSN